MRAFLGNWSGDAQLWWAGADRARLTFDIEVPASGRHRLFAVLTRAPDFGVFRVAVGDSPSDSEIDLYGPFVTHTAPIDLGTFTLPAGPSTIAIENMGRNLRSRGHGFGLDYLLVRRE